MRPVVRGAAPREYSAYGDARGDLIERMGNYCNYCDMSLNNQPQVEHVQPKSLVPGLKREWSNFLLACGYCNSVKSNKPVDREGDVFADTDNLMVAIDTAGVPMTVKDGLPQDDEQRAQDFLNLVGRDEYPFRARNPDRWRSRISAMIQIEKTRQRINQYPDNIPLKEQAVATALGFGHFPMWLMAFDHDRDMRKRLVEAFPGTALNCFDDEFRPIARPGGKLTGPQ